MIPVDDEGNVPFLRDPSDLPQELEGRLDDAAFALHRLQDDRGRLRDSAVRIRQDPFEVPGGLHAAVVPSIGALSEGAAVAIWKGGEVRLRGERRQGRLRLDLGAERHGTGALPVVRSLERDHGVPVAVMAGELEGRFNRVRTRGRSEEDARLVP